MERCIYVKKLFSLLLAIIVGCGASAEFTQNWIGNSSTLWLIPNISAVTSLGK